MSNSDHQPSPAHISHSPIDLQDCGLAALSALIGDRWTLLVLRSLFYGVSRFADIKADIGIPGSTLSDRLKRLLSAGIIEERPYREANARTRAAYGITHKGNSLRIVLMTMMQWGDTHLLKQAAPLIPVSRKTEEPLRLAYVTAADRAVDEQDVRFVLRK